MQSLMSVAQIIAPLIAGLLIQNQPLDVEDVITKVVLQGQLTPFSGLLHFWSDSFTIFYWDGSIFVRAGKPLSVEGRYYGDPAEADEVTNRRSKAMETDSSSSVRKINAPRIVRALLCAAGLHDAWSQPNKWDGHVDVIRLNVKSAMHDELQCAVCKHCRTIYVRKDNGDSLGK